MFKSILLPTDGSATALRAAQEVATLAKGTSEPPKITVVLAIAPLTVGQSDFDDEIVMRQNARMREHAETALATTASIFAEQDLACATKIIEGDPVSLALSREVAAGGYDMVAMGSRGLGMQKSDLHYLGSVTEHVIRRVSIPVLVIPTQREG